MKKLFVILSLLLSTISFESQAATLSWAKTPKMGLRHILSGSGSELIGGTIFSARHKSEGGIWQRWTFNSKGTTDVKINVTQVSIGDFPLYAVKFDGKFISDVVAGVHTGVFNYTGILTSGLHTLKVIAHNSANPKGDQTISISAVPVPAAAWLFGSAFIAMIGMRGRTFAVKRITA